MSEMIPRPDRPTARNPVSMARFRRESFWQVIFPVAFVFLLSIGMLVLLMLTAGAEGASIVADYSLILVLVPVLVAGLIGLLLIGALGYLVGKLIGFIPPYTYIAHDAMHRVYLAVDRGTNRIASVVITAKSVTEGVNVFLQAQGILPRQNGRSGPAPSGSAAAPSQEQRNG